MKGKLNIVNRDSYPQFVPSPIMHYYTKTRINGVWFEKISHDDRYKELKEKGLNIDITNPELFVNNQKPIDGIFSPLFGADTTQDRPIYACDCHELIGRTNQGRMCPKCGTICRSIEADLRICGYIDIAPYHILSYHGYEAMKKIFKNLDEILTSVHRINVKGKMVEDDLPDILTLYRDYDEKYFPITNLPRKIAFMSKIPVYSARLRPLMRTGNAGLTILDVNKAYMSIVRSRNIIHAFPVISTFSRKGELQRTLNQIQSDFLMVINHVCEQLSGKNGSFRKSMASGRVDNSSRMVITLGTDLRSHEIDIPYQTAMIIYEEEIANYVSKLEDIPISKAISMVMENQMVYSEKFGKYIKQFLSTGYGVWAQIRRNPIISESGILYCRVRKINDNPDDMTMHIPPDILALQAADFDYVFPSQEGMVRLYRNVERLTQ